MVQSIHLVLTRITTYSTLLSGLLWFGYMFVAFLLGYTVTFKEPNIVIASVELVWAVIVLVLALKYFKTDFVFSNDSSERKLNREISA